MITEIVLLTLASVIFVYNAESLIAISENSSFRFRISVSLIIHIISTAMFRLFNEDVLLMIILLSVTYITLVIRVCYKKKCRFSKALYILMLYLSIDSLLASFIKLLMGFINEKFYVANDIATIVGAILAFLIIKMIKRKNIIVETTLIPKHIYILILLSLFFSGGLIEGQLPIWDNTYFGTVFNRVMTAIVIVLLIIIIISLVINCISRAYLQNTSSMLEKQVQAQIEYYEKIGKLSNDLRNFRHDYKNHLICIGTLIEREEYDEAKEYIGKIADRKINSLKEFDSGNAIADAILNDKSEKADKIGAKISFDGYIYKNIAPTDLCIILSNAIDNAIEACEKIEGDAEKTISLDCSYTKGIQIVRIKNPVSEDVEISDNSVRTSKADKAIHGIGLHNIRTTVKKYGGEFGISCENKEFTLSVCFMPLSESVT